MDHNKELKESIGFGLIFVCVKATYNYLARSKKPTITSSATSLALAAGTDVVVDYGKTKKMVAVVR